MIAKTTLIFVLWIVTHCSMTRIGAYETQAQCNATGAEIINQPAVAAIARAAAVCISEERRP